MKIRCLALVAAAALLLSCGSGAVRLSRCYEELPLGSIRPEGWLLETLTRQRDGITATMDLTYPAVLGETNGWLGGDGDCWERGPYWIDGLLPLAYILDDEALKAKAQRWVEWALASQREDGFFGPDRDGTPRNGVQTGLPLDWWPRMVVLKIMQQYYNATADARAMDFFDAYFRYQLATLPDTPIDKWSFWGRYRVGDNLDVVLWYYAQTGKAWLLDLAQILHDQSFDFTGEFLRGDMLATPGSIHCVNLAQGLKEPVVWWQYAQDDRLLEAERKGLGDLRRFNGFANGMFGGDEALHGNSPNQGSELCSAVELMYSYEQMLKITGDVSYADALERVAFNALPAQVSDDFRLHQYFQCPNQAQVVFGNHNFDVAQKGTGQVFGFLTAYPCCLTNQHQGWPKFTQNLWYATAEGGLAAMAYAPCRVSAELGATQVCIEELTRYPFEETVEFRVSTDGAASFPLELRIPSWCSSPELTVNGETVAVGRGGKVTVRRSWQDGDVLRLSLPMRVGSSRWAANSVALERGPLVYALGLEENWVRRDMPSEMRPTYGDCYWEVLTDSPWNYGLRRSQVIDKPGEIEVITDSARLDGPWYWSLDGAPLSLRVRAARVPDWGLYNGDCGPLPWTPFTWPNYSAQEEEVLTLVPYGCTTLRISQFPVF